eukprot:9497134-Pyramimonas_sp.AAC.1
MLVITIDSGPMSCKCWHAASASFWERIVMPEVGRLDHFLPIDGHQILRDVEFSPVPEHRVAHIYEVGVVLAEGLQDLQYH